MRATGSLRRAPPPYASGEDRLADVLAILVAVDVRRRKLVATMSGDRSVPRYAHVITTRRKWSVAEKSIVADVDVAGGSISEVACMHAFHTSLLFRWRRDPGATHVTFGTGPVGLAGVSADGAVAAVAAPIRAARSSVLEIQIDGGRVVRVDADVDEAKLAAIVAELEKTA